MRGMRACSDLPEPRAFFTWAWELMPPAVKLQASNTLRYQVDQVHIPVKDSEQQTIQMSNSGNCRQAPSVLDSGLRQVLLISEKLQD